MTQLISRRNFLLTGAGAAACAILPMPAAIAALPERRIALQHLHTGEKLKTTYWAQGKYIPESIKEINQLMRDFRTGDIATMDPKVLDQMFTLHQLVDSNEKFQIIGGYRSPKTNAMLAGKSSGVAKKSLHMQGKAVDLRLPGTDLKHVHKAALSMKAGGVGYYSASNFVHVDTGRVRQWGS